MRRFRTPDHIILSARCKVRRIGLDDLFFKVPAKFEQYVCADASSFAAALLLPCMKLGEDLVVEDSISARLYAGMNNITRIVAGWGIGLSPINVVAADLVPDEVHSGSSAAFFSGGVDSFYTYLSHQNGSRPITHMLLVNGFDIDPGNPELWNATMSRMRNIAGEAHATLVEIETNLRSLTDPILSWDYSHGGGLAAVALCVRRGLSHVYIPSTLDAAHLCPLGSHPDIDHLWSTEALAVSHDGADVSRVEKVDRQIAHSPLALKHLRVCYANAKGAYNCGKCRKCLLTMVNLYLAGALDRAVTFPDNIDTGLVAGLTLDANSNILWRENLVGLQALGLAPDLQKAIQASLANRVSEIEPYLRRAIRRLDSLDHSYAGGNLRKLKARLTGRSF